MLSLPIAFRSAIGVFAPVFSRPVWQHVKVLMTGAILAPGKRTVTAMLQVMGRSAAPDFQTYHRVLNRAVWSPLTASRLLLRPLVAVCIPRGVVVFGLDDTIERRRGDHITAKGIYRDPVRSSHAHMVQSAVACAGSVVLLTPIAWASRVWALPLLTVLCPSERFWPSAAAAITPCWNAPGKASGSCGAGCLIASWSSWRTAVLRHWNGSPWWRGCPVSV